MPALHFYFQRNYSCDARMNAIIQGLASIFGYLAARGIDAIIGKWLAYALIAWEKESSERSRQEFDKAIRAIKQSSAEKSKAWDDWRERTKSIT
jgi:hypothetical protein